MIIKKAVLTEIGLQSLFGEIRKVWRQHGYVRVSFSSDKPRSLDQNAISHVWYDQVARELGENSELEVKCFCKLHFGVPILRAEDETFRYVYDTAVLHNLTYEQKLKLMEVMEVTSKMSSPQLDRYLKMVQEHYRGRVELKFPEDAESPRQVRRAA